MMSDSMMAVGHCPSDMIPCGTMSTPMVACSGHLLGGFRTRETMWPYFSGGEFMYLRTAVILTAAVAVVLRAAPRGERLTSVFQTTLMRWGAGGCRASAPSTPGTAFR